MATGGDFFDGTPFGKGMRTGGVGGMASERFGNIPGMSGGLPGFGAGLPGMGGIPGMGGGSGGGGSTSSGAPAGVGEGLNETGGSGGFDVGGMWRELGGFPGTLRDDDILNPGVADSQMFGALAKYAPEALAAVNSGMASTANAQLAAQQGVAGGYDQLGQQNVTNADKYQRQVDPEFYSQRSNISNALDKYLGSYDPNHLSPTELAEISRGINATTGPMAGSNMNTIKNAQVFGSAGTERWKNFGDAVTRAAGVLPTLKSGIDGFATANTGAGATAANAAASNALNANFGFSTSALGDIAGNTQARIQRSKDLWDKGKASSPSSIFAGIL